MPTIDVCHQPPGQTDKWNSITIDTNSLDGHDNHDGDIWPPFPGVTEGMNWDADGYGIWANDCALIVEPTPSPSGTPSESPGVPGGPETPGTPGTATETPSEPGTGVLPVTGAGDVTQGLIVLALLMAIAGLMLWIGGHRDDK